MEAFIDKIKKIFVYKVNNRINFTPTLVGLGVVILVLSWIFGFMSNGGTATFELSHGQYLVIKGVEAGVVYTITENDYSNEGYKTTVQNSNKATATGENLVAFTNTKDSVDANTTTGTVNQAQTMYTTTSAVTSGRSTGDASHLILWSLGILAAGAVLGITIYKRRKHN